jgi:2-phospho-L-lactate guanylyltransferase
VRTLAIVPVKRFAAAKQRLAAALEGADRERLAAAMLSDSLAAISASDGLESMLVVTGDARATELAAELGIEVVPDGADAGQSAAALAGIDRAIELGADRVALLPGDCPLADPAEIDQLLEATSSAVVIVPDRHGTGTNGLVLSPPDAIEPSFGEGSCARHAALARDAGHDPEIRPLASLGLDLDTPDDLDALRVAIAELPSERAPSTRKALG